MAHSSEFIKKQKERLLEKREELREEIDRLENQDSYLEESKESEGRNIDAMADDVQEDVQHGNTQTLVDELEEDLKQVEKALTKIKEGSYGIDEKTGEEIPRERLEAYPEATTNAEEQPKN